MPIRPAEQFAGVDTAPLIPVQVASDLLAQRLSERRRRRIDRIVDRRLLSVTVVLEDLYDPHNGAAVLRSCEAHGLHHVHVVSSTGDFAYAPGVTKYADKWLDVFVHRDIESCCSMLSSAGFDLWGAAPPALDDSQIESLPVSQVPVEKPLALLLGNEHAGLSDRALAHARRFHLPMFGFSESLNLSVSAALSVADITRRRRHLLKREGDLPESAKKQLRAAYYGRAVGHAADLLKRDLKQV